MDVFAFRIILHFVPVPLIIGHHADAALLSLAAYGFAASGKPWIASGTLIAALPCRTPTARTTATTHAWSCC
jgi:hypothetical protein